MMKMTKTGTITIDPTGQIDADGFSFDGQPDPGQYVSDMVIEWAIKMLEKNTIKMLEENKTPLDQDGEGA